MSEAQVEYSEETIKGLRDLFKATDPDNTGVLNAKQLEECLAIVGLFATDEDIAFITKHFDSNGDGRLQIEELIENMHIINAHVQYREDLMAAFAMFDTTGDGYIRLPELKAVLLFNDFMTPDEASKHLTKLINKYDKNHDGKFNYAEFVEIFVAKDLDPEKLEQNRQEALKKAEEARIERRKKRAKKGESTKS